jgi:chromate transporter
MNTAPQMNDSQSPAPVSFGQALLFWLKLGFVSFGGPAGQIAIMHAELVERRRWISEKRFLHALNYCMVLPGPEAQQLATYIGWLMHKSQGGLVAGGLFVLPSLFMLIALSWLYIAWGDMPVVAGIFYGIKPAVTAIVVQAAHRIGSRALKNNGLWAIAAASFVAIFALDVPFPIIVLGAAAIGYAWGRWRPSDFKAGSGHGASSQGYGPALIDDATPTPAHARFTWWGLVKVLGVGAVLWTLPMVWLTASLGWDHTLTQMGWFFTKAALLTFGGAYAVLPYVYQGAVSHYGWLTPPQMIDGLALGETTPGGICRFCRRLCQGPVRARELVSCRSSGSRTGHLVHLSALVCVHPGWRTPGGVHPQRVAPDRATHGHHRSRGGGDPQSRNVLWLPRAVAARIFQRG